MKRFLPFIFFLLLILGLVLAVFYINQQTKTTGQATVTRVFSPENSYLFASPLLASAGGQEKIRITVFALDSQGVGVQGEAVLVGQNKNLFIEQIQSVTDSLGKAVFDISSTEAAEYLIEVAVEGKNLPQGVSVTFR